MELYCSTKAKNKSSIKGKLDEESQEITEYYNNLIMNYLSPCLLYGGKSWKTVDVNKSESATKARISRKIFFSKAYVDIYYGTQKQKLTSYRLWLGGENQKRDYYESLTKACRLFGF